MAQVPAADVRGLRAPAGTAATTGVSRKRAAESQTSAAEFSALFVCAQQARKTALRDRARQAQETRPDTREKTDQADKAPKDKTAERETRADALRESNAEQQAPDPSRADQMRDSLQDAPANERSAEQATASEQAPSTNTQTQVSGNADVGTNPVSLQATSPDAASGDTSPQNTSEANLSGASVQAGSVAAQPAAANPFVKQQPATNAGKSTSEGEPAGAPVSGTTAHAGGSQVQRVVATAAQVAVNAGGEEGVTTKGETGGRAQSGQFEQALDAATAGKTARTAKGGFAAPKPEIQNPVNLSEADTLHELARVLRAASKDGHSNLLMRLDPPELGRVEVDVRMHGDVLTLRMEAQTPAGHEALQSKLADLRTALEQQGIQVGQVQVELRPTSPGMPQDTPPQQQGWQGGGQAHGGGTQRQGGEPQSGDGRPGWTRHAETTVEAGTMRGLDMVA